MNKEFIRDNDKVRCCRSNIAKMNVFEYIYYELFHWEFFQDAFYCLSKSFKEFIKNGGVFFYNLVFILFSPITIIIMAFVRVKNAKEQCFENAINN